MMTAKTIPNRMEKRFKASSLLKSQRQMPTPLKSSGAYQARRESSALKKAGDRLLIFFDFLCFR